MLMIMDPAPQPLPTPQPASPPVMDIKAPPRVPSNEPVKAAPVESGDPLPNSVDLKKQNTKQAKPPKVPKPLRAKGNGTALAVMSTIIIVLGLGAMFVYAYLQTGR